MLIRREDKELIHNLAVLGALFGACVFIFLVVHLSNQAHEQNAEHTEFQQTHAALAKLSVPEAGSDEAVVDQDILKQVQEHFEQKQPEVETGCEDSFWLKLPKWGFWGVCAAGGVAGGIAGFSTIWATGWMGSVFVYAFIRLMYKVIRKVAPNSAAAQVSHRGNTNETEPFSFERNRQRVFPTLVKLMFLLLMALGVLAIVVWNVTGL
ncbi:MAG: hypothetical protein ACYSUT_00180 [Planctomycetota bacterium]|jgi:hypothetical protein